MRPSHALLFWFGIGALASSLVGCRQNPADVPKEPVVYVPPYGWSSALPSSRGLDTLLLQQGINEFKTRNFIYSFLLVQDTFLVAEYYHPFLLQNNDYDIHSASKSYISALVGIAIDKGFIDSVGQKIYDFFPEEVSSVDDPRKLDITIEHLLTMRGGMDYTEGNDYSSILTPESNWIHIMLGFPLKFTPGESFWYATPEIHLLSAIITRATRMSTLAFARTFLFQPLSIDVKFWYQDPQGIYFGGTGMNFTPRDMARFGLLYLKKGSIDGQQIIPEEWITRSFIPRNAQNVQWGTTNTVNYGYSWWVQNGPVDTLFIAAGFAGQFIVGSYQKNMVAVVTSNDNVDEQAADNQFTDILNIIDQYILPAAPVQ